MGEVKQFPGNKWYRLVFSGEDDDGNPLDYFRCQFLEDFPVLDRLETMVDAMEIIMLREQTGQLPPTLRIISHLLHGIKLTLRNDPHFNEPQAGGDK
jgi:hypothetical protein